MQTRCKAPPSASVCRKTSTMLACRARPSNVDSAEGRVDTLTTTRRSPRSPCSARKTRAKAPRPNSRSKPVRDRSRPRPSGNVPGFDEPVKRGHRQGAVEGEQPAQVAGLIGEAAEIFGRVGVEVVGFGQAVFPIDQFGDRFGRQLVEIVLGADRFALLPAGREVFHDGREVRRQPRVGPVGGRAR